MIWYWVWLVQITERKDGLEPEKSEVWKNLVMIEAENAAAAYEKAMDHGRSETGDVQGSLTLDSAPAVARFLGVQEMGIMHEGVGDLCEILFRIERNSPLQVQTQIPTRQQILDSLK